MSGECEKCGEHCLDCKCIPPEVEEMQERIREYFKSMNATSVDIVYICENFLLCICQFCGTSKKDFIEMLSKHWDSYENYIKRKSDPQSPP